MALIMGRAGLLSGYLISIRLPTPHRHPRHPGHLQGFHSWPTSAHVHRPAARGASLGNIVSVDTDTGVALLRR